VGSDGFEGSRASDRKSNVREEWEGARDNKNKIEQIQGDREVSQSFRQAAKRELKWLKVCLVCMQLPASVSSWVCFFYSNLFLWMSVSFAIDGFCWWMMTDEQIHK
jgi:hypothetical protein